MLQPKLKEAEKDLLGYSNLVNDLEYFVEQHPEFFKVEEMKQQYKSLWQELEILHTCALNDWEKLGRPCMFQSFWEQKYHQEARIQLKKMDEFLTMIL